MVSDIGQTLFASLNNGIAGGIAFGLGGQNSAKEIVEAIKNKLLK